MLTLSTAEGTAKTPGKTPGGLEEHSLGGPPLSPRGELTLGGALTGKETYTGFRVFPVFYNDYTGLL